MQFIFYGVGLLLFILLFVMIIRSIFRKPKKNVRVGIVKKDIKHEWQSRSYPSCTFKVKPTGLEYEDGRIEVKILEIINYLDNTDEERSYAMKIIKRNCKYVDKKDVTWQTYKPLTLVDDDSLNKLLNNEEVFIGDSRIKLDREYKYDEIVNVMLR